MGDESTGMTDMQFNSFLELIARFVEASAKDVDDAVRIIREAKVTAD